MEIETDFIIFKDDLKYNEKEISNNIKDKNKNTEDSDINTEINKNIEKGSKKKKYIESNSMTKYNELIPDFSELEKKYIIRNVDNEHYSLTDEFKSLLSKLLGIKNKVEIIDRNFIDLSIISFDKNYLLLYFQLNKKEALLVNKLKGKLQFYDLNSNKMLDSTKILDVIEDLIDIKELMKNYISYLLMLVL